MTFINCSRTPLRIIRSRKSYQWRCHNLLNLCLSGVITRWIYLHFKWWLTWLTLPLSRLKISCAYRYLTFELSDDSLDWLCIWVECQLAWLTLRLSWVTTLWTSHNCSSFSSSVQPALISAWSAFSSDSCFCNSSSIRARDSGSSNDQREVVGLIGGLYLMKNQSTDSSDKG